MLNNKGKEASVGGLVFLVAVLIIIYTIVLPPCDKCKLLGDGSCSNVCEGEIEAKVILDVSPGKVGDLLDEDKDHELGSVNLFIKNEPETRTLSNSLRVSNGLFGESDQLLDFNLNDLDNLDTLDLSFAVIESRGDIIITLNGKQIFNQHLSSNRVQTVRLPSDFLEKTNTLRLQVSPPGLAFWLSNKYSLKDIKLREDFELVHSSEVLTFSISSSELDSIKDSDLDFFVFCKGTSGQANILKAYLNDNLVFSELIGCLNDDFSVDLDEDDFVNGVNELEFSVSGGEYLISDIEIQTDVTGRIFPSYIFYIRTEVFEDADRFYLDLDMDNNNKIAEIIINDDTIDLDTDRSFVEFDITNLIKRGNNFIEIRPDTDFRIHSLKIGFE